MILGMAVKGYADEPGATRSSTAKEIAADLTAIGIPLDEDTVRAKLQNATDEFGVDLLPPHDVKRR